MFNQIYEYIQPVLHQYLTGFRTGYGCQDNNQAVGIVAIDLSKAFDCMSHGLLITKLSAYMALVWMLAK